MSEQRDVIVTNLIGCARCHGEGHDDVAFERLRFPITVLDDEGEPARATHWAMCPTLSEPILMAVVQRDEAVW